MTAYTNLGDIFAIDLKKNIEFAKEHEGFRKHEYICPAGRRTIYYGHNTDDDPDPMETGEVVLKNDLERAVRELEMVFQEQFYFLPNEVQFVLVDMVFNMGLETFLRFKNMIIAVKERDWDRMWKEIKYRDGMKCQELSDYYKQVNRRAKKLVGIIKKLANEQKKE